VYVQGQPGGPRGAGQQQLQAPTALSAQQSGVGGGNSPTTQQQAQQQQQGGVAAGGSSGAEQLLTGVDSLGLPGSHLDPSLEVSHLLDTCLLLSNNTSLMCERCSRLPCFEELCSCV
jgi:hypothetical protein